MSQTGVEAAAPPICSVGCFWISGPSHQTRQVTGSGRTDLGWLTLWLGVDHPRGLGTPQRDGVGISRERVLQDDPIQTKVVGNFVAIDVEERERIATVLGDERRDG